MESYKKELDIIKFNSQFDENDTKQQQFHEKKYNKTSKIKQRNEIHLIDKNILKMRLAFDHIINKIELLQNPIIDITQNEELAQGTIMLSFFIGLMTLILAGLMKE